MFSVQADLARAQGEEQGLHLQITALNLEMKQKDSQLADLRKAKQQLEQQVAATKAQTDKAEADLKGTAAQLAQAQTSLASQQAANQPAADAAQDPNTAPQVCLLMCECNIMLQQLQVFFSSVTYSS